MTLLTGTVGNDSYTGTSGQSDTAAIGSSQKKAIFSFDGTNWIVNSAAGTDTLSSVEFAQFSDATFGLVPGFGTLSTNTGGHSMEKSSLARLADGGWIVSGQATNDGDGLGIYTQRYSASGEPVGTQMLVNTTVAGVQTESSAAGLADGGYVVAWNNFTQNLSTYVWETSVVLQRFDAAGSKVGSEVTVDAVAGSLTGIEVAQVAGGGYAVTWGESSGSDYTLSAQLYDSTGAEVGTELVLASSAASQLTGLEVVGLGSGYVAVWQKGTSIFEQRIASTGAKIGTAVQVNGSETSNLEPVVAALENGGHIVAWLGSAAGSYQQSVFVQRFGSGGSKLGTAVAVDTGSAIYSDSISATGLEDGGFVVVWHGYLNSTQGMYLQRFDSAGVATGDVQLVGNSGYAYSVSDPDVVALASGGFAVSWTSSGNVYTQRFNADGDQAMSEITGTSGNDTITFSGSARVKLIGLAGNDSLTGGSGADLLDGGAGADTMTGGSGNDTYVWQTGDTIVETSAGGIDTVRTSVSYTLASRYLENAVLTGSAKADLVGNGNANRLVGNSADNVLNGAGGVDTLIGGAGSDTYVIDSAGEQAIEAAGGGIDTVISSVSFTLGANLEHLRLGGAAAIDGTGNAEANLITGNAYANRLDGQAGADTLIGGLGDDTYVLTAGAMDEYREYAGEGRDTIEINKSWVLNSAADSIENLTLREGGAFSGTGDAIANVILGNSSANLIDGKAGADTMDGASGSDTYIVDNTGDRASEFAYGNVDLVKSSVNHTLGDNIENLTLTTSADLTGSGNTLGNVITGNAGANRLDGKGGSDTLLGGAGNDRLTSADGMDSLVGGLGNDVYVVSTETDEIVEQSAEGTDSVIATVTRSYTLNDNVEKLTLIGTHIDGHGNVLANTITGTTGNNLLDGAGGADTLTGLAGDDVYLVDSAGDVVVEAASAGTDEVFARVTWTLGANLENLTLEGSGAINGTGNTLANRLIGNDAANTLAAGSGNDLLYGHGGADKIDGGTGNDTLKGGAGADNFSFTTALSASTNVDRITDFVAVDDRIQLDNAVFKAFTATGAIVSGNLRAGAGVTSAADANDHILYNSTTGALYYDADGSGSGSAALQFATLSTGLTLTAADFYII